MSSQHLLSEKAKNAKLV